MRPVSKWPVGHVFMRDGGTEMVEQDYNPYQDSNAILRLNLGKYCSYCEVYSSDLVVEHVISKLQNTALITAWDNFLLACRRCNGSDNKGRKSVDLSQVYLPHRNNTAYVFEYKEGGFVGIHPHITDTTQILKAKTLLNLVGLDKYPGNPKYPASKTYVQGFPNNDIRWSERRSEWEKAQRKLIEYQKGAFTAELVASYAKQRGFFSVWFTVFEAHPEVKQALIAGFRGTDSNSFDLVSFEPVPRNPDDLSDPV
jgi:HNH endonuclease